VRRREKNGKTALFFVVDSLETGRALVEHGADIHVKDDTGKTCLHFACFNGHLDWIRYLVEQGGKLEVCSCLPVCVVCVCVCVCVLCVLCVVCVLCVCVCVWRLMRVDECRNAITLGSTQFWACWPRAIWRPAPTFIRSCPVWTSRARWPTSTRPSSTLYSRYCYFASFAFSPVSAHFY
jgi:hypothetical protein